MSDHQPGGAAGADSRPGDREREESGHTGPVIRDKRRLDPQTGEVRVEQSAGDEVDPAGEADASEGSEAQVESPDAVLAAERLEDLRRLQAEYLNFKRRVERDRGRDREAGVASVIEALLPVMDDIHSAREHGELTDGPLAAIAEKIDQTLGRFGVQRVGEVGEPFDPNRHEALMHLAEADVPEGATETTVVQVLQPGFLVGDRVVRAARVAVADPPEPTGDSA